MLKLITFIYGKPCENDGSLKAKFLRFSFWSMVVFFTCGLVSAVIDCFFDLSLIPATIIFVLVLPFFPRFVYSANLKLHGLKREK
jgi:hypothetical protein